MSRSLTIISVSAGLVLGLAAIGAKDVYRTLTRPAITGKMIVDAQQAHRRKREKLVADLIRMGAVEWIIACAHEHGEIGEPVETAIEDCNPDWKLGPPEKTDA